MVRSKEGDGEVPEVQVRLTLKLEKIVGVVIYGEHLDGLFAALGSLALSPQIFSRDGQASSPQLRRAGYQPMTFWLGST